MRMRRRNQRGMRTRTEMTGGGGEEENDDTEGVGRAEGRDKGAT